MKKLTVCIITAFLFAGALGLYGCAEEKTATEKKEGIPALAGEWLCEDNPLDDPENYTGYLKLKIEESGKFALYDAESENYGISGTMTLISDDEIKLKCVSAQFNPPPTWINIKKKQKITYRTKSEDKLYLTYENQKTKESSTLIFDRIVSGGNQ